MGFDAKKIKDELILWLRSWFEENGRGCTAVIGISGGKDSSVVAALCVEALGKDRVLGVLLPNGVQSDIDMSELLVGHLGIGHITINIKDSYETILAALGETIGIASEQTRVNLAPRLRMATLYAVSQSRNGRVANTCNLSEDWVGYSTRYGDAAGDFSPLGSLTVGEVKDVGRAAGLPAILVDKTPSDGLCGKTDEDNVGFSYAALDRYIRTGACDDARTKAMIDERHRKNLFKLRPMPTFAYEEEG